MFRALNSKFMALTSNEQASVQIQWKVVYFHGTENATSWHFHGIFSTFDVGHENIACKIHAYFQWFAEISVDFQGNFMALSWL